MTHVGSHPPEAFFFTFGEKRRFFGRGGDDATDPAVWVQGSRGRYFSPIVFGECGGFAVVVAFAPPPPPLLFFCKQGTSLGTRGGRGFLTLGASILSLKPLC